MLFDLGTCGEFCFDDGSKQAKSRSSQEFSIWTVVRFLITHELVKHWTSQNKQAKGYSKLNLQHILEAVIKNGISLGPIEEQNNLQMELCESCIKQTGQRLGE